MRRNAKKKHIKLVVLNPFPQLREQLASCSLIGEPRGITQKLQFIIIMNVVLLKAEILVIKKAFLFLPIVHNTDL